MGVTSRLCNYIAGLSYDSLPDTLVQRLKLHLLDASGAALYGRLTPWGKSLTDYAIAESAPGDAVVWGSDTHLTPTHAAFANTTLTHAFELDDRRVASYLHPASATLPSALATATEVEVDGKDLITAIVAGYEVGIRIGKCIGQGAWSRGYYVPGISGAYAAATTAAKLRGLSAAQLAQVYAVVATQAAGLYSPTQIKRLNIGRGTYNGMSAVDLVCRGVTGFGDILDDRHNRFPRAFAGDAVDYAALVEGLGESFETPLVELKPYVSSRPCHTTIDACLALRRDTANFSPDQLAAIELHINTARFTDAVEFGDPQDVPSALMSVRYCATVATLDGDVFLEQFKDSRVAADDVHDLLARVKVVEEPSFNAIGREGRDRVRVRWLFKDGTVKEEDRTVAKGHPKMPLSDQEVLDKFDRLLAGVVNEARSRELKDLFLRLETVCPAEISAALTFTETVA